MSPYQEVVTKAVKIQRYSMTIPTFTWTKLEPSPDPEHGVPCTRSSHSISIVKRNDGSSSLFVYGGEHIARTPIPKNDAGWFCDADCSQWKWIDCSSSPPDRIAQGQAVYDDRYVYIFGGRAGVAMQESAMNDMWVFDAVSETWSEVIPDLSDGSDPVPEARSFHKMICIGSNLYVFGGCGAVSGRLNDLHKFDIINKKWYNLGRSELRGRGGPNVIPINSGSMVAIVAGFAGEETCDGHAFDIVNGKWSSEMLTEKLTGLRPRSVCSSGSFPSLGVSIIFGGEVDPSDRGHEGAGGFENDIVVLDEKTGAFLETMKAPSGTSNWPTQRGWSDSASVDLGNGHGQFFIFGGLSGDDASPIRLDDLWRLDLHASS